MSSAMLLLGLGVLAGVRAQVTTASIALLPQFSGLPLSGEIIGTGADGTTYAISASGTDAGDVPFTMTVVQDATHVSEEVSLATGLGANVQCAYDSQGVGTCTVVLEGAGTGTETDAAPSTTVISGTVPMFAVPVTTASASATTTQASGGSSVTSSSSAESSSRSSGAEHAVATVSLAAIFPMLLAAFINA